MIVSKERIKAFAPKVRDDFVAVIVDHWADAEGFGLGLALRAQHFMAQLATETGGLKRLDENLNYSAEGLCKTFPTHFSATDSQRYASNPQAIANRAYAGRLGNGDEASGDGWLYRGSGFIQLTGRANFRARGTEIGMPLEAQPELARTPAPGFKAALAFWKAVGANVAADGNDLVRVRRLVNGGTNGLADARIWFARARSIFRAGESEPLADGAELEAVLGRLAELGFDPATGAPEGTAAFDPLASFQESVGLAPTGVYDDETLDALTDRPGESVPPE